MTVDEIFNKLVTHMYEGVIIHQEMARAYDFLGLWGLSKCHIYHTFEEKQGYCLLTHYYTSHYFKLLQLEEISKSKIIPETWYKYTTKAVDGNTKRNAVKELMTKWAEWERDTKNFYQEMRQELTSINELAAAMKLDCYIRDVSKELHQVEKDLIEFESTGYDIGNIIKWSHSLNKKYKKKLGW